MKNMKKIFALLLAVVMVMGLSVTAFAAGTGSITVKNADSTATYKAYKIFDVTYSGDNYSYTISKDSAWLDTIITYIGGYTKVGDVWYASTDVTNGVVNTDATAATKFTSDTKGLTLTLSANGDEYVVTTTDAFSAADFAEALYKALNGYTNDEGNKVNPTVTGVSGTDLTYDSTTKTASVSGLDLGYYFVTSSVGSLANLTTTNPNVTIYDKNEQPPFDKTVDDEDVEIGQTVNYTITGEVPSTTGYTKYDYKVSDTLSDGLTFNKDVKVKFGDTEITLSTVTDASATLTDGQIRYTNNGFELYFDMTQHQDAVDKAITITYSAVVNENAVVTTEGNPNNATLVYSNDPNDTTSTDTETDEEKVYTVDLTIDKYAGGQTVDSYTYTDENNETVTVYSKDGTTYYTDTSLTTVATVPDDATVTKGEAVTVTSTKLSGAEFVLVKKDASGNETYYQATVYAYTYTSGEDTVTVYSKDGENYYSDIACTKTATVPEGTTPTKGAVADVSWVSSIDEATKVTTDDKGAATFDGLEEGTYYLRETEAPDGYNLLTSDQEVTITRTETAGDTGTTVTITGNTAEVVNNAGTELPSTGGIGTTIFYVVGSILVIGAAILLITKKRMSGTKE